jgi:hypothetical protein
MVPVAVVQVGWEMFNTGAEREAAAALMTAGVAGEVQPELFLTVTL